MMQYSDRDKNTSSLAGSPLATVNFFFY